MRVGGGLSRDTTPLGFLYSTVPSGPLAFPQATSFCQTPKYFPCSQKFKICLKNITNLKPCLTQQILNLFPKLTQIARSTLPYHLLLFGSTSLETWVFIKNLVYTSLDTSSLAECSKGWRQDLEPVILLKYKEDLVRDYQKFSSSMIIEHLHCQLSCLSHNRVHTDHCHVHTAACRISAQAQEGTSPGFHSYSKWPTVDLQHQRPDRGGVQSTTRRSATGWPSLNLVKMTLLHSQLMYVLWFVLPMKCFCCWNLSPPFQTGGKHVFISKVCDAQPSCKLGKLLLAWREQGKL